MRNRIAQARHDAGLTLVQLGELVGLADNTISRYETGKREPKLETWQRLADALGVTVPYLQGQTVDTDIDELLPVSVVTDYIADMYPTDEVVRGLIDAVIAQQDANKRPKSGAPDRNYIRKTIRPFAPQVRAALVQWHVASDGGITDYAKAAEVIRAMLTVFAHVRTEVPALNPGRRFATWALSNDVTQEFPKYQDAVNLTAPTGDALHEWLEDPSTANYTTALTYLQSMMESLIDTFKVFSEKERNS